LGNARSTNDPAGRNPHLYGKKRERNLEWGEGGGNESAGLPSGVGCLDVQNNKP